jgi:hypothetical protein
MYVEDLQIMKTNDPLEPLLVLSIFGRSGTTLLMQLLGTSEQIVFDRDYPFETRYLTYLLRWALILQEGYQPDADWNADENNKAPGDWIGPFPYSNAKYWSGREMWIPCFKCAWREFSRIPADQRGAGNRYYAEKTPFWVPDYLQQAVPYKALLLIRDPRDVFLSITEFDKKRGFPGFVREAAEDDWTFAQRLVKLFRERIPVIHRETAKQNSMLVTYESLASNLSAESERIGKWLGVQLDPFAVEAQVSAFSHHMTSRNRYESIARWKKEMHEDIRNLFKEELANELAYFGYMDGTDVS